MSNVMQHVFVETNWVVGYAAPAHHQIKAATKLIERARAGELMLHVPAICLMEARNPILKFQPRHEADAIRQFLSWARENSTIDAAKDQVVRRVLDMFESEVRKELRNLDTRLAKLHTIPGVHVFPMNDRMLRLAVDLTSSSLDLKPFDLSILAAILGRAEELRESGETELAFAEMDSDLQPWNKQGQMKQPLTKLYDERRIWVYGDFQLQSPSPPAGWPTS